MVKLVKFKDYTDNNGKLVPFYCNSKKNFPFLNKRIFLVYGKKNLKRSDHAHKKCKQLLFCVSGKIEVIVNKKKKFIITEKKNTALLVPELNWTEVYFKKKGSILMVFCDQNYSSKEYLRKYNKFLEYKKKKS